MQFLSKREGEVLPALKPNEMRAILGKKGIYVERDTMLYTTCVQGSVNIPGLAEHAESVVLKTPPLTPEFLAIALGFLKAAYDQHGGEAALILLYYPADQTYEWFCPKQWVKGDWKNNRMAAWGADVHFDVPLQIPPGAIIFGDIHSHPGFGPTPSYTDTTDERYKDGLHLIAGYITGDTNWKGEPDIPKLNADFVIDQGRVHLNEFFVIGGAIPDADTWPEPPPEWLAQCEVKETPPFQYGRYSHGSRDDFVPFDDEYYGSDYMGGSFGGTKAGDDEDLTDVDDYYLSKKERKRQGRIERLMSGED